jgi:hypothetical protein
MSVSCVFFGPLRCSLVLSLSLLVSGCAVQPSAPPTADKATTEQRLDDLERRVQHLEGRPPVEVPYRNREEIQTHIKFLESERAKLLVKYTDQHPAVRDIDRKLLILNEQLHRLAP